MKIARIPDTNFMRILNKFFESEDFQDWKDKIINFITADDVKILAELFNPQNVFENFNGNVNYHECDNVLIEDIIEEICIDLFEISENEMKTCVSTCFVKQSPDYDFPIVSEMCRNMFKTSLMNFAKNHNAICLTGGIMNFLREFRIIAENKRFEEMFKLPERLEAEFDYFEEFLKTRFKS